MSTLSIIYLILISKAIISINSSYGMEFISKHHVSKIKHCKANLYDLPWQFITTKKRRRLSLTFHHRGITVGVAPHPHGNPVRRDPIPAVLPLMWFPLPRFPRRIPAATIAVRPLMPTSWIRVIFRITHEGNLAVVTASGRVTVIEFLSLRDSNLLSYSSTSIIIMLMLLCRYCSGVRYRRRHPRYLEN